MSTITFNGVSSSTIAGLIIQTLPPITKPQMRTQVTQVDGRDGDIIDLLGYNSYDKPVVIGITRGADIDAIAKYFSGSGQLILSNEPDRVYNVDIYNQIDFAALFRFRTATVKFVAQPYKYLRAEAATVLNVSTQTHLDVTSAGLEASKPLIRLEGSGDVTIKLNTVPIFDITIDESYVLIDSELEDAYITGVLKNTLMTGEFIVLQPGVNTIGWDVVGGSLTRIEVLPRSRWL